MNQFLTLRAGVKHTSLGRGKNAAPYSFGIPFCREILKSERLCICSCSKDGQ